MMIPVVAVAYNRPRSLKRLLGSLENARYKEDCVPLIISIDKGDNRDVLQIAEEFVWTHGEKKVVYQPENLKLRRHILKCGDYALEYGGVIILEDDMYVSKDFYQYVSEALDFVAQDRRIGGISLYNHRYNVNKFEPFEPMPDGYDNWYFQFASSWGEAWTKEQWINFKTWYEANGMNDIAGDNIPEKVTNWSASSWLKYFIKYLIESDKYFLYPRESLTTNFGDAGTHVGFDNTDFQVPLRDNCQPFRFSTLEESHAVYDAFFESRRLATILDIPSDKLNVDIYGSKKNTNGRYLLTQKVLDLKIVRSFARSMRPIDANVVYLIPGNDIFLYDTMETEKNPNKFNDIRAIKYRMRVFEKSTYSGIVKLFVNEVSTKLKKKFKKKRKTKK